MKNQLVLLTTEQSKRSRSVPAGQAAVTDPLRAVPERAERAHVGASAARAALREAIRRSTEREAARRAAREAALVAALTQPHLPFDARRPDKDAA